MTNSTPSASSSEQRRAALAKLISLLGAETAGPPSAAALPPDRVGPFLRSLLAQTFSQTPEGLELRAAWRQVGAGLERILRVLAAGEAPHPAP